MPPFWQGRESQAPIREMPINSLAHQLRLMKAFGQRSESGRPPRPTRAQLPLSPRTTRDLATHLWQRGRKASEVHKGGAGWGCKGHAVVGSIRPCVNYRLTGDVPMAPGLL